MSRSLRSRSKAAGEEKNLQDETKKVDAKKTTTTKTKIVTSEKDVRVSKITKIDKMPRVLRSRSKAGEEKNLEDETKKIEPKKTITKRSKPAAAVTRETSVRLAKIKNDDLSKKLKIKNHNISPSSPVLRDRTNLKITRSKQQISKEENPSQMKRPTLKESFAKGKKKSPVKPSPTKQKIQSPVYKTAKIIPTEKPTSDEDKLYDFEHWNDSSKEETGKKKRKRNTAKNPPAKKVKTTTVTQSRIPKWKKDLKQAKITLPKLGQYSKINKVPSATKAKGKSNILKVIEDFHRIPNANDPASIKPLNKNQLAVKVHNNPPADDNYDDAGGVGMPFEQPGAPDDDDNNDQSMTTEEDKLPVPKQNEKLVLTPIKAFRKTIAFNQKPSVQKNSSEKEQRKSGDNDEKLVLTPVKAFRRTAVFNDESLQQNTTMDDTLIGQSLSPIPKRNQINFDESSPWRPCVVPLKQSSFSRVKNVVQSTPQTKKLTEKLTKGKKEESTLSVTMEKINEINNENIDDSPRKNVSNSSKSPRKFGTELLNISGSKSESSATLGATLTTTIIEKEVDKNIVLPTVLPIVTADVSEVSVDENSENKENVNKSPKKSPTKRNRLLLDSPRRSFGKPSWPKSISPIKTSEPASSIYDKQNNINQQPGPSGLEQKRQPLVERRVKKQSNLHFFLNLPDMPESTKITTPHGIFDDLNPSQSITKKTVKKTTNENNTKQLNVDNLFGFEDDIVDDNNDGVLNDSSLFSSPTKKVVPIKKLTKPLVKKPRIISDDYLQRVTRLSVGQMNKLLKDDKTKNKNEKLKKDVESKNEKTPKMDKIEAIKAHFGSTKAAVVEAKSFSDTFDAMSEEQEQSEIADVPLFVDLEPVHFNQVIH